MRTATLHGAARRMGVTDKERALYVAWGNMTQRCFNPQNPAFKHYGGRGIVTCSSWTFFALFWRDVQSSWFPGGTLERTDNELGYNRQNCEWTTQHAQVHNRRPNGKHAEEPF